MKVVIGVDESFCASGCFEHIAAHSWPNDAEFKFVNVVRRDPLAFFDHSHEQLEEHFVYSLSARMAYRAAGLVIASESVREDLAKTLTKFATNWDADLIVVGSKPKSTLERLILGSFSESILDHAPCPVLILRNAHAEFNAFENLLVAIDGSAQDTAVLDWICSQPWSARTQLHFVGIVEALPEDYMNAEMPVEQAMLILDEYISNKDKALQVLKASIQPYASQLQNWQCRIHVDEGEPAAKIGHIAKQQQNDLIILGSHGYSGLSKLLLGSVSARVLPQAPCSVLIVKPRSGEAIRQKYADCSSEMFIDNIRNDEDYTPHVGMTLK